MLRIISKLSTIKQLNLNICQKSVRSLIYPQVMHLQFRKLPTRHFRFPTFPNDVCRISVLFTAILIPQFTCYFRPSNSPNDSFVLCPLFLFPSYAHIQIRLNNLDHPATNVERKGRLIKGFDSRGSNYSFPSLCYRFPTRSYPA